MADNGTRKKREKGPKYHRWDNAKQTYILLKPFQLDPQIDKATGERQTNIRVLPLGFKQLLIEKGLYPEYQRYFQEKGYQIVEKDDVTTTTLPAAPIRRTTQKRRPPLAPEAPAPVSAPESVTSVEIPVPVPVPQTKTPTPTTLYPTQDDPEFNIKIAERKEFHDTRYDGTLTPIQARAEQACRAEFELLPHQLFIKNYLSMQTPYTSLLLYHGLGTGKTCTAIGIAEEMRSYMKQIGMNRRILVLASPNVIQNFRLQLFDPSKLKLENGVWNIRSCVGNAILNELNPTHLKDLNKERLIANVQAIIKTYYDFQGYIKFSNQVATALEGYPEGDPRRQRKIQSMFNDRLIIIDEVHNIRLTRDNEDLTTANYLYRIAKAAKNLRFVLLSATPMYNSYKEIIWLTNLMNANDGRPEITVDQVFTKTGEFRTPTPADQDPVGEELLRHKLTGYVSYVRGENPYTFPFRIYRSNLPTLPPHTPPTYPPIYLTKIEGLQERVYKAILAGLRPAAAPEATSPGPEPPSAVDLMETLETLDNVGYEQLRVPIQALNIVYQDLPTEADPTAPTPTRFDDYVGKAGLLRIMEPLKDGQFQYRPDAPRVFSPELLPIYSQKIATILQAIQDSSGIVLVYSEFIDAGIVPLALALEEAGYARFQHPRHRSPNLLVHPATTARPPARPPTLGSYAMITGNRTYSPSNTDELAALTSRENLYGERVRVVLISRAGAEGLDFKNIRQIHIMEPWYNMSRIEQIIGRGVRNLSHCQLPFEERNVEIYMYATQTSDGAPTADTYLYELAFKKAKQIGRVSRLMKESSVDCILHQEQHQFTVDHLAQIPENRVLHLRTSHGDMDYHPGDRPYTAVCDYLDTCPDRCQPDVAPSDPRLGQNRTTYSTEYMNTNRIRIVERIRQLFLRQPYYPIDVLVSALRPEAGPPYPLEQIYYALTYLIENRNEFLVDSRGRLGNLVNRGEIYAFQPVEITDPGISVFDRTFPVEYKVPKIRLQLPTEFTPEDTTAPDDPDQPVDLAAGEPAIPAPGPQAQAPTQASAPVLLQYIQQQLQELLTPLPTKNVSKQQWTDYQHTASLLPELQSVYGISQDQVVRYMVDHTVDGLPLHAKLTLASAPTPAPPAGAAGLGHDVTPLVQAYFQRRTYQVAGVIGAGPRGATYLVLPQATGGLAVYRATQDPNPNTPTTWAEAEYTDLETVREHVVDPLKRTFDPFSRNLALLVGFMVPEHPTEIQSPSIFKVKDYTKMAKSGNAKGENMKKAGKKRVGDVLEIAHRFLGRPLTPTRLQDLLSNQYSQGALCMLLELLLRHSRETTTPPVPPKKLYVTPEEAAMIRITTEKRV